MRGLSAFLELNRALSRQLTPDHVHEANVFGAYRKIGTIVLSHPKVRRVADVGAGKSWQFPPYYKTWYGLELIGIDIDPVEMDANPVLDRRIVCDVVEGIPLPDESVDLVMAHSGVEHFEDNERFLKNAFRILRPGGYFLAQFPGRYASFAIANRLLPGWLASKVLYLSMGETDVLGFKAHYDRTNCKAFRKLATAVGFSEVYHLPGYFGAKYFESLGPLFVIPYLYDSICYCLGARELASYNLFLLQKPGHEADGEPLWLYAWK
jgi:SAM-dependent methyltransferase